MLLVLEAQTPAPLPSATPTPQQIFANAFRQLQTYPVPDYVVWTTTWWNHVRTAIRGSWTDETDLGYWLHRYAVRNSDGMENSTVPNDPKGTTASGRLPAAYIAPQFFGPFGWSVRRPIAGRIDMDVPPPQHGETSMAPDLESGLKTIAVVSSNASPNYAIDLAGIERVNDHPTYRLRLRPLRDPQRHNLRDLWIDTRTFDLWKAHYIGLYAIRGPASSSDITSYFTPVGPYWPITHSVWTWTDPFDFGEVSHYTFDVQTNAIAFPASLPDWMFDARAYKLHQTAGGQDILGIVLNAPSQLPKADAPP